MLLFLVNMILDLTMWLSNFLKIFFTWVKISSHKNGAGMISFRETFFLGILAKMLILWDLVEFRNNIISPTFSFTLLWLQSRFTFQTGIIYRIHVKQKNIYYNLNKFTTTKNSLTLVHCNLTKFCYNATQPCFYM